MSKKIPELDTEAWNGKKTDIGGVGSGMLECPVAENVAVRLAGVKEDVDFLADELVAGFDFRTKRPL